MNSSTLQIEENDEIQVVFLKTIEAVIIVINVLYSLRFLTKKLSYHGFRPLFGLEDIYYNNQDGNRYGTSSRCPKIVIMDL
ncbi:MAG TPA: hypothetical protein VIP70_08190 [Nitrososphaeraceae archaeon]